MTKINPLSARLLRRSANKVFGTGGWGQKFEWPVPRGHGKDLVFSVRVPDGTQLIGVDELAATAAAAGGPSWLRERTGAIAPSAPGLTMICSAALIADSEPDNVVLTLTAALAEGLSGLSDGTVAELEGPATGEELRRTVTHESDRAMLISRLSVERPDRGSDPVPMLLYQYLLEGRYGVLSMAFTTTNTGMITEPTGRQTFEAIAATSWIGEISAY